MAFAEGMTAAQCREQARQARQRSAESFERSDTDGFLSQWASDLTAQRWEQQAKLVEAGGTWPFSALFDAETGEMVPAKVVTTRYGRKWAVFACDADVDTYGAPVVAWVGTSEGAIAKRGYRRGFVERPAIVVINGSGTGLSGHAWVEVVPATRGFVRAEEATA
jgi:hypothetical protein